MNQLLFNKQSIYRLINPNETFYLQKQVYIFWEGTQVAVSLTKILKRSLDPRREKTCSLAESLPRLSRFGEESAARHSDSPKAQATD